MKFIKLTGQNGQTLAFNVANIFCIDPIVGEEGSKIHSSDMNDAFLVQETVNTILTMIGDL